jgi:hypothetical protein
MANCGRRDLVKGIGDGQAVTVEAIFYSSTPLQTTMIPTVYHAPARWRSIRHQSNSGFVGHLVDDSSSRERRRRLPWSTVQAAAHTAPVQRGGTSAPAFDPTVSSRSRSAKTLSAPDPLASPPASPIRHAADGVSAGEAVRRVEWETGPVPNLESRVIFPRPAPTVAPASASATPSGDPVRQEGWRGQSHPHYSIHQPRLHQLNPHRVSEGRQPQDGSRTPPKLTEPVKLGHFARIDPSSPQRQPLRADPAQQADPAVQAQTSKVRRKAGSTIVRILLLPFRICLFIIHVFVLTIGLMTITGALGFWWVANHQKEANEMAVTALEYIETNKERLKPVMDFLKPPIDSLLPPKVKTGPGESKDPLGTPSH